MGIVHEEIWECKNCGYEFIAEEGMYEADPNDFGTTHFVSAYYCPKCGNLKNLSSCVGLNRPQEGNENLQRWDSDICENCNTTMKMLNKPRFKLFSKSYKCPECKKRTLRYKCEGDEWQT